MDDQHMTSLYVLIAFEIAALLIGLQVVEASEARLSRVWITASNLALSSIASVTILSVIALAFL